MGKKAYDVTYGTHDAECWRRHLSCAVKRAEKFELALRNISECDVIHSENDYEVMTAREALGENLGK